MTVLAEAPATRARRRLVVLVEHLIAHSKDHADERTMLSNDAVATGLLDVALHDLATAHRSLSAFLGSISGAG